MLACEFHPLAEKKFDKAAAYYEALESGKGRELLQQIQTAVEQARQFPESAPISRGSVRSLVIQPSQRWSYTLHYRVISGVIRVPRGGASKVSAVLLA